METITWAEFQQLEADEIAAGPCFKVTVDGLPGFVVVVRPEQAMADRVYGLCSMIDTSRGNPVRVRKELVSAPWSALTPLAYDWTDIWDESPAPSGHVLPEPQHVLGGLVSGAPVPYREGPPEPHPLYCRHCGQAPCVSPEACDRYG